MIEQRIAIIKDIFHDVDVNIKKGDVKVFCPQHSHHKKKLEINVQKNNFHCWVCDYSGNIFKLLKQFASHEQKKRYYSTLDFKYTSRFLDKDEEKTIELPCEFKFLLDHTKDRTAQTALRKLSKLRLTKNNIIQNIVGFCDEGDFKDRLIFPSRDLNGNINYFVSRSLSDFVSKKYLDCDGVHKSDIIFNELYIDWNRPIVIVEGVKAYLKHSQYLNIVPILCSDFKEHFKLFQEIIMNDAPCVYVAFDADATKKANDAMKKLASHGIDVRLVQIPSQPDEIDTEDFIDLISQAKSFNKDEYLLGKIRSL